MSVHVTVVIQQEEDWYVAKCLDNDIASQGKTLAEAMDNLKEALELYYEEPGDFPTAKSKEVRKSHYSDYFGALSQESYFEIVEALKDTER